MPVNKILVKGEKHSSVVPTESPESLLTLEASYVTSGPTRGVAERHEVSLDNGKMVEFVFDDGTTWLCNANTLEEVFPGAAQKTRSAGGDGTFEIPQTLRGQAAERGFSDVVLKVVNVFAKKAVAGVVNEVVKKLAADLERKQLENGSGLYRIDDGFTLQKFEAVPTAKPYLLFLHGTNSSTRGSFAELSAQKRGNTTVWAELKRIYGQNTLAFQHETLTQSPLQNVLNLVKGLPASATLHLVSHSRGGLIGDVLSRFCNSNESLRGFDAAEIAYLKKEGRTNSTDDKDKMGDVEYIEAIEAALKNKKIIVEKFVRVACPAAGTILASRRLDNFLNVSLNLIGLGAGIAATPVYTGFKNLIAAVVDSKNSLEALPGIEAMNPDSPFIKVLNSPGTTIKVDNPLVVISGNCKMSLNLKALLIIASKLFYFTNNDLVVNTLSMYQGSQRHKALMYLFDETADVDHFHYFANEKTGTALLEALRSNGDLAAAGFKTQEQKQLALYGRNILLKLDGGQLHSETVSGAKPIAVLLPGIMGSNLSIGNESVWINYWDFLKGGLGRLDVGKNNGIEAKSIVASSYKKLFDYLSPAYDVVTFPYDWRLPLTDSAAAFNKKMLELLEYSQPIKIIGHSMGGVLVRDFIIHHPGTWERLKGSKDFRLLFLGAPLGGSFRIPAVLFGQDIVINKLSKIDILHTKKELLGFFSQMPGLWSLLPLAADEGADFAQSTVWEKMAEAMNDKEWPLPKMNGNTVNWLQDYRNAVRKNAAGIDYTAAVYIAGKDKATPCGYRIDTLPDGTKELVFLSTAEGDGSVTWESGIPQKLAEARAVYYADVTHGSLANEPSLFDGIADILRTGFTNLLPKTRPAVRSEETLFVMPVPQDFDLSEESVTRGLLGLEAAERPKAPAKKTAPLLLSVSNGDLRYATFPVLAGHFQGDGILYAEKRLDETLSGALSVRHRLGLYPGPIGTNTVIVSGEGSAKGAIIVGLDSAGTLTSFQLTQTVEQGVSKYLLELNSRHSFKNEVAAASDAVGISTVLIGSGYGGLSVENSARAIVQGVQNANAKIDQVNTGRMNLIERIEFIELYEDRALSCFYAVSKLAKDRDGSLNVSIDKSGFKTLFGAQKRIPAEISEGWWQRISVRLEEDEKNTGEKGPEGGAENRVRCLQFSVSTAGAREEKRSVYISPVGIDSMINDSADKNRWSPELAKTLFELLVPLDFKEQLKKQCNINWIVDKFTAAYPWELLQDKVADARPLSINGGMVRQLATEKYRLRINAVTNDQALVIADPDLQGFVNQLPGAEEEGRMVDTLLKQNGFDSKPSIRESGTEILKKLNTGDYRIVHLAGHGLFNEKDPKRSGMAIGKNEFLSTFHIYQMSTVPELVFVNCCYLGKVQGLSEAYYSNRYKLAANIGTQLIENGVKAVVAAGWEVNDAAALEFTRLFYQYMFDNYNFGTALQEARKAIFEKYGNANNTWGAYQAYGDPFYKFRDNVALKKEYKPEFVIAEEAEMELHNLLSNLQTPNYTQQEQVERLEAISKAVDKADVRSALITELEALIYADMYRYDRAIEKFADVLTMEKAAFSVSTLEKYCNVRMKKYVYDKLKQKKEGDGAEKGDPAEVLKKIENVIIDLNDLVRISDTAERNSLLGSACKRKGLLLGEEDREKKREAYQTAAYYYQKSNAVKSRAYTLTNWYELERILMFENGCGWGGTATSPDKKEYSLPLKEAALKNVNSLRQDAALSGQDMNYWDMIMKPNAGLCLLVIEGAGGEDKPWNDVLDQYREVWNKAGARGDKFSEIEHLALLLDALTLTDKPDAEPLRRGLELVKKGLEGMV